MPFGLTKHAMQRLQQRGIPQMVIELLERFGSSMRCGGAERVFFDKPARRRLQAHLGGARGLRAIEAWLRVYIVIGDNGQVITVAHQQDRFVRP
jgi:hypothetical protein